eukprot:4910333-Lingulodinium_polyedra.AAC.1
MPEMAGGKTREPHRQRASCCCRPRPGRGGRPCPVGRRARAGRSGHPSPVSLWTRPARGRCRQSRP